MYYVSHYIYCTFEINSYLYNVINMSCWVNGLHWAQCISYTGFVCSLITIYVSMTKPLQHSRWRCINTLHVVKALDCINMRSHTLCAICMPYLIQSVLMSCFASIPEWLIAIINIHVLMFTARFYAHGMPMCVFIGRHIHSSWPSPV